MSSKLRVIYDGLYAGVETYLLARSARKKGRKNATAVTKNPRVSQEYKTVIRPYWQQFRVRTPKKFWFELFANADSEYSPKYIPDDLWFHRILPYYNNVIFAKAHQDKCLANVFFPDVKRPVTVVKNIAGVFYDDALNLLTREEAIAQCHNRGRVIVKPSVGSGQGHGINFYDSDSFTDGDIEDIFRQYSHDFIVQEKLTQHEALSRLNPKSVNTIRMSTFLHNNEIHLLSTLLRVGGDGSEVDNISQGGYKCTIDPDGRLQEKGFSYGCGHWEYMEAYPNGVRFRDVVVPGFQKAVELVSTQAKKMSHFKIIGWDVAIDPDGEPILIEFNVLPDQNENAGGPTFGDLTDEVLAEVFGRRDGKDSK